MFADSNFKFNENGGKFSERVKNTVEKGEIACYELFLLFTVFSKDLSYFTWYLHVYSTSLLKTLWDKEKLLVSCNFSFSHSVFYLFGELSSISIKFEFVDCNIFVWRSLKFVVGKGLRLKPLFTRLRVSQFSDSETSDVTESTDMSEAGDCSSGMLLSTSESSSHAAFTPVKQTHLWPTVYPHVTSWKEFCNLPQTAEFYTCLIHQSVLEQDTLDQYPCTGECQDVHE